MSELAVGSLKGLAANSFVIDIAAGSTLNVPPPAILQVVTTEFDTVFTASVNTGATTAVTGLTATITPSSTSSKVLVSVDLVGATGGVSGVEFPRPMGVIVKRAGIAIGVGAAAGSRTRITFTVGQSAESQTDRPGSGSVQILDSPVTASAVTYSVDVLNMISSDTTLFVNRAQALGSSDADIARVGRGASRIVLMEVAG